MHRYIDHAGLNIDLFDLVNKCGDPPGDLHAARGNSGEHYLFKPGIPFNDFVRNPPKRSANCFRVHDRERGW